MHRKLTHCLFRLPVGLAALLLAIELASPAKAVFDVPDACRAGSGTYNGELAGNFHYRTCVRNGIETLDLKFEGAFAHEHDYPNTPAIIFAERIPSDNGIIMITGNGRRDAVIVAQIGSCGISGSWTLTDNDVEYSGTFNANGSGPGSPCTSSSFPNASPATGGLCGATGSASLAATLGLCLVGRGIFPRRRRR